MALMDKNEIFTLRVDDAVEFNESQFVVRQRYVITSMVREFYLFIFDGGVTMLYDKDRDKYYISKREVLGELEDFPRKFEYGKLKFKRLFKELMVFSIEKEDGKNSDKAKVGFYSELGGRIIFAYKFNDEFVTYFGFPMDTKNLTIYGTGRI